MTFVKIECASNNIINNIIIITFISWGQNSENKTEILSSDIVLLVLLYFSNSNSTIPSGLPLIHIPSYDTPDVWIIDPSPLNMSPHHWPCVVTSMDPNKYKLVVIIDCH